MKKAYRFIFAIAISILAFAACQKEVDKVDIDEVKTVEVVVSMSDETKSFTDAGGIKWETGDVLKFSDGTTEWTSLSSVVSPDGYTATFTFPGELNSTARQGWFYTPNTHKIAPYDEFTYPASLTQDVAGEMNKDYLFLTSGLNLITIEAGVPIPKVNMYILSAICRVIPYTTFWRDESILSVKVENNTSMEGTMRINRGNPANFKPVSLGANSIEVNLNTPFSIAGIYKAELSKGIYIPLIHIPLYQYKFIVETDKATYTFADNTNVIQPYNNSVRNMLLDLNHTNATRSEGLITIDGSYADWDVIEPTKVAECTSNVLGSALQKMKVYADKRYINVYFEYDTNQISDAAAWTDTRFVINSDNVSTTGGGYSGFLGNDADIFINGSFTQNGVISYWPSLFEWSGVDGESTWTWTQNTNVSGFGSGAGGSGKYELRIELLPMKNQGVIFANSFTIGMHLVQGSVSEVLPNGTVDKLPVTIY